MHVQIWRQTAAATFEEWFTRPRHLAYVYVKIKAKTKMAASPKEKFDAAVAIIQSLPKNGKYLEQNYGINVIELFKNYVNLWTRWFSLVK